MKFKYAHQMTYEEKNHAVCECGHSYHHHDYDDDPNGGWASQRQRMMPMDCSFCKDKCPGFRVMEKSAAA